MCRPTAQVGKPGDGVPQALRGGVRGETLALRKQGILLAGAPPHLLPSQKLITATWQLAG